MWSWNRYKGKITFSNDTIIDIFFVLRSYILSKCLFKHLNSRSMSLSCCKQKLFVTSKVFFSNSVCLCFHESISSLLKFIHVFWNIIVCLKCYFTQHIWCKKKQMKSNNYVKIFKAHFLALIENEHLDYHLSKQPLT